MPPILRRSRFRWDAVSRQARQGGGNRHAEDEEIAKYRHKWLDALLIGTDVTAVNALFDTNGFGANALSVAGIISGPGTVAQNGTGTTVLQGTQTYTGVTNVNAGRLEVDGSLVAASTVNVGTLGTLAGTGTIKFILSVILAGFLFVPGPRFAATIRNNLVRIGTNRHTCDDF